MALLNVDMEKRSGKKRTLFHYFGGGKSSNQEEENTVSVNIPPSDAIATDTIQTNIKKTKYVHSFQEQWTRKWPWLRISGDVRSDTEGEGMFCDMCVKHKKTNAFTSGCTNYRTSTMERHILSQDHLQALQADAMQKHFTEATSSAIRKSAADPRVCIIYR